MCVICAFLYMHLHWEMSGKAEARDACVKTAGGSCGSENGKAFL